MSTASSQLAELKPELPLPTIESIRTRLSTCKLESSQVEVRIELLATDDSRLKFEKLAQKLSQQPILVFHGTDRQYAQSIRTHGLLPANTRLPAGSDLLTVPKVHGGVDGIWTSVYAQTAFGYTDQNKQPYKFCMFAAWVLRGNGSGDSFYNDGSQSVLVINAQAAHHVLLLYQISLAELSPSIEVIRTAFSGISTVCANSLKFERVATADERKRFEAATKLSNQDPVLCFHGTKLEYASSIKKHGLLPSATPLSGEFGLKSVPCSNQGKNAVWLNMAAAGAVKKSVRCGASHFCIFVVWANPGKQSNVTADMDGRVTTIDSHYASGELVMHAHAVKNILLLYQVTL